jgi:hypothetical protein
MEDTVTLQDGEGGTIDGQIVMLPNAVDGAFVVQTSDGRALQMTADELKAQKVRGYVVEKDGKKFQMLPMSDTRAGDFGGGIDFRFMKANK